jgi:hypothetical protein
MADPSHIGGGVTVRSTGATSVISGRNWPAGFFLVGGVAAAGVMPIVGLSWLPAVTLAGITLALGAGCRWRLRISSEEVTLDWTCLGIPLRRQRFALDVLVQEDEPDEGILIGSESIPVNSRVRPALERAIREALIRAAASNPNGGRGPYR